MLDQKLKKRSLHRAKIIEGQIKALLKAIEKEKYCIDLLTQSLSIQNSLKSLDAFMLENHLKTHVKPGNAKDIKELMRIYTLSKK
ncbi:MAG: metal-sensitive transcriptional regulator [Candidatus Doudnabacteria bacterium]|nr:metal-sensitive transcriptional regulator [Candidatus Doudnabacteria bacterium]